ncbi:DUF2071 domain-containing protein [Cytophagaceae bacterium ABcell3]|nr:DUF2071 domain-containing protein [Cytophagaceae bacterium ABcell3]
MDTFKTLPIKYSGELHDVRLVNFSVRKTELGEHINYPLDPVEWENDRVLFSMVDVRLRQMKPSFLPEVFNFAYRHIAFRLLVKDAPVNGGENQGVFFYRSFTDKALVKLGGNFFTSYKLEKAEFTDKNGDTEIRQGSKFLKYRLGEALEEPNEALVNLQRKIGALDRAYSLVDNELMVTQIQREKWPLLPVLLIDFQTNFFKTARFEGAYRVPETIYYQWLPARKEEI